jgi:uncharacterized protein (DUF2132 family)
MTTAGEQPKNPLHGVRLEQILNELVQEMGWEMMAERVRVACFTSDPSISSSLKFLRKTPWAREKVEALYVAMKRQQRHHRSPPSGARESER